MRPDDGKALSGGCVGSALARSREAGWRLQKDSSWLESEEMGKTSARMIGLENVTGFRI